MEGLTFQESPLDFLFILARYKFAARFLRKHHHVLDVGCGTCSGSILMSKFAEKVTASDFDENLLESNRKQYAHLTNIDFRKLDLLNKPKDFGQYDAVVSMDVIEHFTEDQMPTVTQAYADLTKDSGFAVIGTPNVHSRPYASKRRVETHPFEFSPEQYEERLREHFKNVFIFSMTDEVVSTGFNKMAWYLMAICTK